ncbi:hypothetical protein ACH5RR_011153 [Cinchona calisaya]|uniref:WRKY domain-containing protein n=1 Tax=Cinchona calisaya TaxID=153742 RepID=A0ABD3A434_9GENT
MAEDKVSNDSVSPHEEEDCSKEGFKEDEVESAIAEMSEVREENARLKTLLEKIEKDYKSLQMRFGDICPPILEAEKTSFITDPPPRNDQQVDQELELVSLCLGRRNPSEPKIKNDNASCSSTIKNSKEEGQHLKEEGLKLGLDFSSFKEEFKSDPSPENSALDQTKEEETAGETWPPSKVLKTMRSDQDDDLAHASAKRARVSVRARCDTPTMNDGCQWRKYGQKIAKGNPCPRAYYRCTVAPSCPVRKQVQRCADDMSILITTYEGTHNHPLPISATAMASTTSAAASMLLSGSSSSSQHILGSSSSIAPNTLTSNLHGLNDNLKTRPYNYFANSSSPPFPTITLDLTIPNPSTANSSPQFSMFPSTPRLPSTSLSFSPSQSNVVLPTLWANGNLNYGAIPYNKSYIVNSLQLPAGRTSAQEQLYNQQPYMQKNYQPPFSDQALTETLTKAITSDPSFRSVIAAAITTMVGGGGGASATQPNGNNKVENLGKNLKWDEQMRKQQSQPAAFSISNGAAASATTGENRDQTN